MLSGPKGNFYTLCYRFNASVLRSLTHIHLFIRLYVDLVTTASCHYTTVPGLLVAKSFRPFHFDRLTRKTFDGKETKKEK